MCPVISVQCTCQSIFVLGAGDCRATASGNGVSQLRPPGDVLRPPDLTVIPKRPALSPLLSSQWRSCRPHRHPPPPPPTPLHQGERLSAVGFLPPLMSLSFPMRQFLGWGWGGAESPRQAPAPGAPNRPPPPHPPTHLPCLPDVTPKVFFAFLKKLPCYKTEGKEPDSAVAVICWWS